MLALTSIKQWLPLAALLQRLFAYSNAYSNAPATLHSLSARAEADPEKPSDLTVKLFSGSGCTGKGNPLTNITYNKTWEYSLYSIHLSRNLHGSEALYIHGAGPSSEAALGDASRSSSQSKASESASNLVRMTATPSPSFRSNHPPSTSSHASSSTPSATTRPSNSVSASLPHRSSLPPGASKSISNAASAEKEMKSATTPEPTDKSTSGIRINAPVSSSSKAPSASSTSPPTSPKAMGITSGGVQIKPITKRDEPTHAVAAAAAAEALKRRGENGKAPACGRELRVLGKGTVEGCYDVESLGGCIRFAN